MNEVTPACMYPTISWEVIIDTDHEELYLLVKTTTHFLHACRLVGVHRDCRIPREFPGM